MKKSRTREERRARRTFIGQVTILFLMGVLLALSFCRAAAMETPISGEEYLQSIGASNEARAELTEVWKEW